MSSVCLDIELHERRVNIILLNIPIFHMAGPLNVTLSLADIRQWFCGSGYIEDDVALKSPGYDPSNVVWRGFETMTLLYGKETDDVSPFSEMFN